MESAIHRFTDLFRQLGLPDDPISIERFITMHRPLPPEIALADAPFWSSAQADFLSQEIEDDADWAELVDQLDASMR